MKECNKYKEAMQKRFYDNIRHEVKQSQLFGNRRMKIDWIYPDCLGMQGNKLDVQNPNEVSPDKKKKFFVKLCIDLAEKLKIKWNDVLKAFFGNKQNQLLSLK
jgi:hypothetical protein